MKISLCLAAAAVCSSALHANDWPGFRGPNGDNSVPDAKIVSAFPAGGPKVLWSLDVSEGYGGAAISGDEAFFMDRINQEKDVLTCIGVADGKVRWKWESNVPGRISHPGSRSVPTVEEDAVYCTSGFGHVYCVDRKTHKKRWIVDVVKTFGSSVPRFGYSIHPVIHGDKCIIAPTGDEVGLAALDKKSGKTIWKSKPVGGSHSSPILVKLAGREMVVMPGSERGTALYLTGFDPKDGKQLFRWEEPLGGGIHNSIPNVTVVNTDTAFLTGGYGQGTKVLKFTEKDGEISVALAGKLSAGSRLHPALKVGDKLYLAAGSGRGGRFGRRRGGPGGGRPGGRPEGGRPEGGRPEGGRPEGGRPEGGRPEGGRPEGGRPEGGAGRPGGGAPGATSQSGLVCTDVGGKVLWATGTSPGLGEGSLLNLGGIIVSQDGGDGTLRLIKPGAAFKELASGKVFTKELGRELWAPMAFADGKLLMRSQHEMVCVDIGLAEGKPEKAE